MDMYQMTMAKDDAWFIMNELGALGSVHFVDLNKGSKLSRSPMLARFGAVMNLSED
jgi:hypothetical protein